MAKKYKSYGATRSLGALFRRTVLQAPESGRISGNVPKESGVHGQKESPSVESSPTIEKNACDTYLDSSALIKLYIPEVHSGAVSLFVSNLQQPLPFSHLHDLEMKNGLRLKIFRREASQESAEATIQLIERDHSTGVLHRPFLNWFDVFRKAELLSRDCSSSVGCRSLDLMHVASALLLESRDFLTFDDRQSTLAKKVGLTVIHL